MSTRRAIVITGAGVRAGVPWAGAQTTRQHRIAILSAPRVRRVVVIRSPAPKGRPPRSVVRQGTARSLGLTLPRTLLLRVDEVI